jgi:hypothetical protein
MAVMSNICSSLPAGGAYRKLLGGVYRPGSIAWSGMPNSPTTPGPSRSMASVSAFALRDENDGGADRSLGGKS